LYSACVSLVFRLYSAYTPLQEQSRLHRDGIQESLSNEMRRGTLADSKAMRAKSLILGVLCAAAVVGTAIWAGVGYQTRLRLEEENQALRQQLDPMAELVAENERLSNLVAQASSSQPLSEEQLRELLRLRGEVVTLRQQGKAPESLPNEDRQVPTIVAPAAPAVENLPKASWAFVGYGTPNAALQSFLWAANKGDLKTLVGGLTGDAQKIAQAVLASKTESEIAAVAITQLAGMKSLRIINREVRDEETVVLTTESDEEGGPQRRKAMMKKVGGDWKLYGYVP
jgi:hypothetical protein